MQARPSVAPGAQPAALPPFETVVANPWLADPDGVPPSNVAGLVRIYLHNIPPDYFSLADLGDLVRVCACGRAGGAQLAASDSHATPACALRETWLRV